MNRNQTAIVVLLALLIGYGAGYFTNKISFPATSVQTTVQKQQQYKHPLVLGIERTKQLLAAGKLQDAQKFLRDQLRVYPQAEEARRARELLGQINTELFFSDKSLYAKTEYVVERGDSLARIARKLNSTPELIMRTNSLDSTLIHPGDRLLVPDDEFTLTIDLPNERVIVHHGDGFFKQYPIQSIALPRSSQSQMATKVKAVTFWKDGERIAAGTQAEVDETTPWIHLARPGYILYGVSEEGGVDGDTVELSDDEAEPPIHNDEQPRSSPNPNIPSRGIALLKDDLAELQMLIRRGTPVTIIRERK